MIHLYRIIAHVEQGTALYLLRVGEGPGFLRGEYGYAPGRDRVEKSAAGSRVPPRAKAKPALKTGDTQQNDFFFFKFIKSSTVTTFFMPVRVSQATSGAGKKKKTLSCSLRRKVRGTAKQENVVTKAVEEDNKKSVYVRTYVPRTGYIQRRGTTVTVVGDRWPQQGLRPEETHPLVRILP